MKRSVVWTIAVFVGLSAFAGQTLSKDAIAISSITKARLLGTTSTNDECPPTEKCYLATSAVIAVPLAGCFDSLSAWAYKVVESGSGRTDVLLAAWNTHHADSREIQCVDREEVLRLFIREGDVAPEHLNVRVLQPTADTLRNVKAGQRLEFIDPTQVQVVEVRPVGGMTEVTVQLGYHGCAAGVILPAVWANDLTFNMATGEVRLRLDVSALRVLPAVDEPVCKALPRPAYQKVLVTGEFTKKQIDVNVLADGSL